MYIFDKKLINIGTLFATFLFGYFIDIAIIILSPIPLSTLPFYLKLVMMIIGCIITAIGIR